jgi:hypothetical protein
LENPAEGAPPLVAAPRHLRRRRLHGEIPDALLVPSAELFPIEPRRASAAGQAAAFQHVETERAARDLVHRRKRLLALVTVLIVITGLAALVLALLLV